MNAFINYIIFCDHLGLLMVILLLISIAIILYTLCLQWRKHRVSLFMGVLLFIVSVVSLAQIIVSAEHEISGSQYHELVKYAGIVPQGKKIIHQHMTKHGYISKLKFCVFMHKIETKKKYQMKKELKSWGGN